MEVMVPPSVVGTGLDEEEELAVVTGAALVLEGIAWEEDITCFTYTQCRIGKNGTMDTLHIKCLLVCILCINLTGCMHFPMRTW